MITIALAIIIRDDKVLIVRRSSGDDYVQKLSWAFHGGKVEPNETVEDALLREVFEETGLYVMIDELIHSRIVPNTYVYAYYYRCSLVPNKHVIVTINPREISEFAWVKGEDTLAHFTSDITVPVANILISLG